MIPNVIRQARRIVGFSWVALFAILIAFALFTHLAPLVGRQLFIIGGGSMEPSIPLGSLVIVTAVDPLTIEAGDPVTIHADNGIVITHRVIRVIDLPEGRFFELKGDANTQADASLVPSRAIVGTANAYVPYAGYVQEYLSTLLGLVAAVTLLGALLLVYTLLEMLERPSGLIRTAQDSSRP